MHNVSLILKDGRKFCAPLYMWRPKEGWFSLVRVKENQPETFRLNNVESAVQHKVMVTQDTITDVDLLKRARDEGWQE